MVVAASQWISTATAATCSSTSPRTPTLTGAACTTLQPSKLTEISNRGTEDVHRHLRPAPGRAWSLCLARRARTGCASLPTCCGRGSSTARWTRLAVYAFPWLAALALVHRQSPPRLSGLTSPWSGWCRWRPSRRRTQRRSMRSLVTATCAWTHHRHLKISVWCRRVGPHGVYCPTMPVKTPSLTSSQNGLHDRPSPGAWEPARYSGSSSYVPGSRSASPSSASRTRRTLTSADTGMVRSRWLALTSQ